MGLHELEVSNVVKMFFATSSICRPARPNRRNSFSASLAAQYAPKSYPSARGAPSPCAFGSTAAL